MELTLAHDPYSKDYEAKIEFAVSKEVLQQRILSNIVAIEQDKHFRMVGDVIMAQTAMQETVQSNMKTEFFKVNEALYIKEKPRYGASSSS
jgi:hypothetical protein